jgi:hypothetical protein
MSGFPPSLPRGGSRTGILSVIAIAVPLLIIFIVVVIEPGVIPIVVAPEPLKRSIQPDDDELVRVGLAGHAPVAEWVVVVVEHAQSSRAQRDDAFNRRSRGSVS